MLADVHGLGSPGLQRHDRERRAVAHADADGAGEHRVAGVVQHDRRRAEGLGVHDEVDGAPRPARAGQPDGHSVGDHVLRRDGDGATDGRALKRDRRRPVTGACDSGFDVVVDDLDGLVGAVHRHLDRVVGPRRLEQRTYPRHGREAPLLLATGRHREVLDAHRTDPVGPADVRDALLQAGTDADRRLVDGEHLARGGVGHDLCRHPTAPSICSSMSLLSSSAYSMGSSRATGSMKPRTIMAMASVSGMPRDIR